MTAISEALAWTRGLTPAQRAAFRRYERMAKLIGATIEATAAPGPYRGPSWELVPDDPAWLAELRSRLCDIERAGGLADMARAPVRPGDLRRFAGERYFP